MPVIKSANTPASIAPFSMKDIEVQARAIVNLAQQRAEQLLAETQIEAEKLKRMAAARGLDEGRKTGLQKGTEEGRKSGHQQALTENTQALTHVLNSLTQALLQIDASRRELETQAINDVIELAIRIAQRVTKRAGLVQPDVLQLNLTEAMKLVVHASDVRIAIHPSQKRVLSDALPALRLQWPALKHVELVEDETIAPGGCRIYSQDCQIDGDLDAQLDRIIAELLPSKDQEASTS